MKHLIITLLTLFMSMVAWSSNLNCTVKEVYTINPNGELKEGGYFPVQGQSFVVDVESGNIKGSVMDNMSSGLCDHLVLSKGTSENSFKLITNCGGGTQAEYLAIKTWSNNEFLAIATSNVVLTGSCK